MAEEKLKGPILVVDDWDIALEVFDRRMRERGFYVIGINDGRKAIEEIEGGLRYKLALIDLSLPRVDGSTVARVSRRVNPNVPVGCYSGYEVKERMGFDFVLQKDPEKLEEVIRYYEMLVKE